MSIETEHHPVWRYRAGRAVKRVDDRVACEAPLEIRVAGRPLAVTMRTPGHDEDLVIGFLVGENIVRDAADIVHVRRCDRAAGDTVDVLLSASVPLDFARLTRHVFASSSCGVCGAATLEALRQQFPPARDGPSVPSTTIDSLPEALRAIQPTFDQTGGTHGAALFSATGSLLVAREDVGRHNAVDKVVGHALRNRMLPLSTSLLLVSGRVSFEIVQKALAAGVPMVAAISAPSSLAIDLAEESNITLIGFLRPGRFNVYTHPHRVTGDSSPYLDATGESSTATTL